MIKLMSRVSMYRQPHLNVNWRPYQVAPAPQGFYVSSSVCSPVIPPMRGNGKNAPVPLMPTMIAVHPGVRQPPIVDVPPVLRGTPPPLHQSHHSKLPATSGSGQKAAGVRPSPPCTPVNHRADSKPQPERPLPKRELCPSPGDDSSTVVGRKRSASPTNYQRLKRQREISRSPNSSPVHIPQISLTTPKKDLVKSPRVPTESDRILGQKLSRHMEFLYNQHKQTEDWMISKMRLRDGLHRVIQTVYPRCGLYMVGSSMTGLATSNSDLDLCLVLTQLEINQQTEAITHLRKVLMLLHQCEFVLRPELILAKVPILKFRDRFSGVEVDLNVNSVVGIRNTQLINNYSSMDCRVPPLCLTVKLWAKAQDINDPFNKTLSSYSLILMIIHYLQVGCHPPVLPCLHKLLPNEFSNTSDVRSLALKLPLPQHCGENKQCLGDLLIGFLHYYGFIFNFQKDAISIRVGGTVPKEVAMNCRSPKNRPSQWNYICIEEPFNRTNTAASVFNKAAFDRIQDTFVCSLEKLRRTLDLDSILCRLDLIRQHSRKSTI